MLTTEVQYEKIVDRRQGIGRALELAQPGDIILVAGKGHENYQILKACIMIFNTKNHYSIYVLFSFLHTFRTA